MARARMCKIGALVMCLMGVHIATSRAGSTGSAMGPSRMDFDDRLIKGQRANASGIYILARQSVALRDMVQKPKSYRQRIIQTVFED